MKNNIPFSSFRFLAEDKNDLFGLRKVFIQNVGQYKDNVPGYGSMGKVLFAFEGMGMSVLFTPKGIIYLQRKAIRKDRPLKEGERFDDDRREERKPTIIQAVVTMEWENANPHTEVVADEIQQAYYTYGTLNKRA